MSSKNKTWETVKANYLRQVEEALSSVNHPRSREIIDDVRSHLDQRFAELEPHQHTWESYQNIITEMGPAGDYAELLGAEPTVRKENISSKFLLAVGLISIGVITLMIFLPRIIPRKYCERKMVNEPDSSFVNDPQVIGTWKSVDFVKDIDDFDPDRKNWRGDLFLKEVSFMKNGRTAGPWTWTKGLIIHPGDMTAAKYVIKGIGGGTFLFFEWLSDDVTIRGMKPSYYVLKKKGLVKGKEIAEKEASETGVAEELAVQAAWDWVELVDEGDYRCSWDEAAVFFKNAITRDQWIASLKQVRNPLGKIVSREIMNKRYLTSVPGGPDGQYVVIQFRTSFENKKSAIETITPMLDNDGAWRVSGYYIK